MLSVNSNPTMPTGTIQSQNAVAFRGKASVSKATLDSLNHYKKTVANMPERKSLFLFANIESSIKSWFKELKLKISGTTTNELIKTSTPQYNNKKTSAFLEFHEALAKKFLKK